jgi:hypothetical protein
MKKPDRDRARGLALRGAILLFIGALGLSGCGGPAAGTVQVSSAAREQVLPHAGGVSKDGKEPATPTKAFSIKQFHKKG